MRRLTLAAGVLGIVGMTALACYADVNSKESGEDSGDDRFVPLFDGKTFGGWFGDTKGHRVEDGKLICTKDGKFLYTDKEYADFHLKFQFKLTPGANNGLGIRTPRKGNPAYAGMELQILDDTAEKYANLQAYQYHGSVYGVVPAKRGHLKPVGEWNDEEVICRGSQVTVILNGVTIVDADVQKAGTPKTLDSQDHPGINREKGHLVLFGHGDWVEFRNLRIKVLE